MSYPQAPGQERRSLRWLWWLIVLLLVLPPVVALLAFRSWRAGVREELGAEIERIRAAGEPTTIEEIIPLIPVGGNNAADVYQQAFSSLQLTEEEEAEVVLPLPEGMDDEWLAAARDVVARNEPCFELLDRASNMPECVFPMNWYDPYSGTFPQYAEMRHAARMLAFRSLVLAEDGKGDEALASLRAAMRMSEHAQSNGMLIGALVGWAIQGITAARAQDVLSAATPSVAACRETFEELDNLDPEAAFARALRLERVVYGLDQTSPFRGSGLPDEMRKGAALLALSIDYDQLAYLRSMRRQIDAVSLPWPRSKEESAGAYREVEADNMFLTVLSRMISPTFSRAFESMEKVNARIGAWQIALALTAYRAEKGRYPDDLAALRAAGWDLPVDPFTQQDFRYRREGDGFVVWSLGPNMIDEGGEYRSPLKDAAAPDDVAFRCER